MLDIILICLFVFLLCVPFIGIHWEKKDYNQGKCKGCGEKLRLFDYDSHGGRGYCCDNCGYQTWVSYKCVDKTR